MLGGIDLSIVALFRAAGSAKMFAEYTLSRFHVTHSQANTGQYIGLPYFSPLIQNCKIIGFSGIGIQNSNSEFKIRIQN